MSLQVLALEHCGLTDKALSYIASILKAQENLMDSLYWNATLRLDVNGQYHNSSNNTNKSDANNSKNNTRKSKSKGEGRGRNTEKNGLSLSNVNKDYLLERVADTHYIYSAGLVACSLYGNSFTSAALLTLTRVLRKNSWLLGE